MQTSDRTDERLAVASYAPPAPATRADADAAVAEAKGIRPPSEPAPPPIGAIALTERSIPAEVSAAWELELLIAGAVTFALFQVPAALDAVLAWAEPRIAGRASQMVTHMGYVYTKSMLYVLIGAFLLNLTARAYWVGLVGLHSVYPRGVRWDRLGSSAGPFAVSEYKRRLASLPAVIGRVDNFASVIFSFAFLIVISCVLSVLSLAVFAGIAYAASTYLLGGEYVGAVMIGLGALFIVPLVVVGTIDKVWGQKMDPDGRGARLLRAGMRYATRVNGSALFGPIFMTLYTNLSKRVMLPVFYGAFLLALTFGFVDLIANVLGFSVGGSPFVPDDKDVKGMDHAYYESMRKPGDPTTVPVIQSDIVQGPYVRLFIPYRPERHDPWMETSCPGSAPLRSTRLHIQRATGRSPRTDSVATRTLACLARLHAVTLDGTPRPDLQYRFHMHPRTGRDGIITYIPTASLAPGAHTLTVMPPPRRPGSKNLTPVEPFEIPFWR